MQTTEDLVGAHIDAFNQRDMSALVAGLANDVVWATGTDSFRGRAAVREMLADAIDGLLPRLEVAAVIADRSRAACELVETYVHEGVEHRASIAVFFDFGGVLIERVKVYREGTADP